jgi:hypothetical protein
MAGLVPLRGLRHLVPLTNDFSDASHRADILGKIKGRVAKNKISKLLDYD